MNLDIYKWTNHVMNIVEQISVQNCEYMAVSYYNYQVNELKKRHDRSRHSIRLKLMFYTNTSDMQLVIYIIMF